MTEKSGTSKMHKGSITEARPTGNEFGRVRIERESAVVPLAVATVGISPLSIL